MTVELPAEPVNRQETYLASIAGQDVELPPEPANRVETYLAYIAENGGGGGGGGSYTAGEGIEIENNTISVDPDEISKMSIKELTSADYNWNSTAGNATTEPFDCIALWLLDAGLYRTAPNTTLRVNTTDSTISTGSSVTFIINNDGPNTWTEAVIYYYGNTVNEHNGQIAITGPDGVKTKNSMIDVPTLVQTTGMSTTDVMSQEATSSMVFLDPVNKKRIQIGKNAAAGQTTDGEVVIGYNSKGRNNTVSVGYNAGTNDARRDNNVNLGAHAQCGSTWSVSLGAYARTTRQGEVNVGTGNQTNGYNSTSYRVIGGVHDPVDAHDAATKGYVDANAGGSSIAYAKNTEFIDNGNVTLYKDSNFTSSYNNGEIYDIMASGGDLSIIVKAVNELSSDYRPVIKLAGGGYPTTRSDAAIDDSGIRLFFYNGETGHHGALVGYDGLALAANFTLSYD